MNKYRNLAIVIREAHDVLLHTDTANAWADAIDTLAKECMQFENALRRGFVFEIDHSENDGFRIAFRLAPNTYQGFWSGDTLTDAFAAALNQVTELMK